MERRELSKPRVDQLGLYILLDWAAESVEPAQWDSRTVRRVESQKLRVVAGENGRGASGNNKDEKKGREKSNKQK